jgi:hypothetical protein
MLKCLNCEYNKKFSKGTITPGGKQNYVVTCIKKSICFEICFDSHISNLPCWEVNNE